MSSQASSQRGHYPQDSILQVVHLVALPWRSDRKSLKLLDLEFANSILFPKGSPWPPTSRRRVVREHCRESRRTRRRCSDVGVPDSSHNHWAHVQLNVRAKAGSKKQLGITDIADHKELTQVEPLPRKSPKKKLDRVLVRVRSHTEAFCKACHIERRLREPKRHKHVATIQCSPSVQPTLQLGGNSCL